MLHSADHNDLGLYLVYDSSTIFAVVELVCNEDVTKTVSIKIRKSLKELNFKENSYILIANRVPAKHRGSRNLAFLQSIPWLAVFDLFDQNSRKDGLHYIFNETNDSVTARVKELEDFKNIQPSEDWSTRGTTWILRSQSMHESDWICHSKAPLWDALSLYRDRSPTGNIHCVFLAMSNDSLQEMADIIESSFSIIGPHARKNITIISEKEEVIDGIVRYSRQGIRKEVTACSIPGCSWEILNSNVKAMLGPIRFNEPGATSELPYCNGESRPVSNKRINSLIDLEVFCSKPSLTSFELDVERAREDFYKGGIINQLNLFHKHDIERTLAKHLLSCVDECLERLSKPSEVSGENETVTLRYESGSGATTLCRRILWEKKSAYRCAVVKAITQETDYQIEVLFSTLFEGDLSRAPPVLILVDNVAEQDVGQLQDKISERMVKCVLLNAVPIAKSSATADTDVPELRQLDNTEIKKVKQLLLKVEREDDKRREAAKKVLEREKRFIWLGLELFGQKYTAIKPRLSHHIEQVISQNLADESKDSYKMILRFCCLLDYYSNGRSIFPHPCATDILLGGRGLNTECINHVEKLHDKFGGLVLEAFNEYNGSRGWRPAHSLVGEVVREEMDLLVVTKGLLMNMNKGYSYVEKYLIHDAVTVCLDREKKLDASFDNKNYPDFVLETSVYDDIWGSLEVRTPFSPLINDVMESHSGKGVEKALDVLITLNENVNTDQHKARTWQQIARLIAYEIGMKKIPKQDPQLARIYKLIGSSHRLNELPTKGFEVAHLVIDQAIKLQESHIHHLVTKGAIFRAELQELEKNCSGGTEEITIMIKKAITTCKDGIAVYDAAQRISNGYLHAMIGKIQTIIRLLEIFKRLPYFAEHYLGQDDSFKNYMNDGIHPEEIKAIFDDSELTYLLSLRKIAIQLSNELFQEIKLRRTRTYKHHEIHELNNAKFRALKLRRQFYLVTKLDRTHLSGDASYQEDIVNDILSKLDETPFSSWKKLPDSTVAVIYTTLSNAINRTPVSNIGMFMCAKAALQLQVKPDIQELSDHVTLWCEKFPKSVWAHLFNYMVHFPVPNGSLKTNVSLAKISIAICNSHTSKGNRKSGAEYLLGKGRGTNAIIRANELSENRQDMNKTKFWKSKEVFARLERLHGRKVGKGVLKYRDIEILFDNERYPKESRDDLWFCLGFTVNGPYAYDPIEDDENTRLKEQFQESQNSSKLPDSTACLASSSDTESNATTSNVKEPLNPELKPANVFTSPLTRSQQTPMSSKLNTSPTRLKEQFQESQNSSKLHDSTACLASSGDTESNATTSNDKEPLNAELKPANVFISPSTRSRQTPMSSKLNASPTRLKEQFQESQNSSKLPDSTACLALSGDTESNATASNVKEPLNPELKPANVFTSPLTCSRQTPMSSKLNASTTKSPAASVPKAITSVPETKLSTSPNSKTCKTSSTTHEAWKNLPSLIIRLRSAGGSQVTFRPSWMDNEGRIHHGTPVKGSRKSVECTKHQSGPAPEGCKFAHPWIADTLQFICTKCTRERKSQCESKNQHDKFIYNLGPYRDSQGRIWTSKK